MRGRIAAGRLVSIGAGLLLLGGCAGSRSPDSGSTDYGTALGNLLAFNSLKAPALPASAGQGDEIVTCPTIEVLDGTASSRVYGSGDQSNANVKYQFSMGEVVRECAHAGGDLTVKIGVEGRVLIGPVGAPGTFDAPIRIAVRREKDEKIVASKLLKIPVTVAPGESQAPFTLVSEPLVVPFITVHGDEDYSILVGFDTKGDGKGDAEAAAKPRKRHGKGA